MGSVLEKIRNMLNIGINRGDRLSISQITRKNLPFFIGWIAIILWLDFNVLPVGSSGGSYGFYGLPGLSTREIFSFVYPVTTAVFILVFNIRKSMSYLGYSSIITLSGIVIEAFLESGPVTYVATILAAVGMGHVLASTGYGFFMVLNNSEKLGAVSVGMFVSAIIGLIRIYCTGSRATEFFGIMRILGLLPLIVCALYYRKSDTEDTFKVGQKMPLRNYAILIIALFVFLLNDFFSPILLNSISAIPESTIVLYRIIGVFTGILIVVSYQLAFRANICHVLNFSFGILTLGYVVIMLSSHRVWLLFSTILLGAAYSMGLISLYYIAGVVLKKYRSLTYYRIGIMLSALFYLLGFIVTRAMGEGYDQGQLTLIVIISISVLMAFFTFTPFMVKVLYSAEWTDDLQRQDVTHTDRLGSYLSEFRLSTREKEVCILLLEGYTMRQISVLLSISYSTVNTYCTSLYRKLNINSRAELMIMFSDFLTR